MLMSELESRFDGPIPRALRRAARRDVATGTRCARTIIRVTGLKPAFAVPAMTNVMIDAFRQHGRASESDLHQAGFTATDIAAHASAAKTAAITHLLANGINPAEINGG